MSYLIVIYAKIFNEFINLLLFVVISDVATICTDSEASFKMHTKKSITWSIWSITKGEMGF